MDAEEIIDYIKSLKKGFDKDLFQNKIDELAYIVDTAGLHYSDFHTLFKVWLNLSIPITKWVSLGSCIVPHNTVEERTVEYALTWIIANYGDQTSFSRIAFLFDWLTAAMENDSVDMISLDAGYDVFYVALTYSSLTPHAMKLVYTLTKPSDVTRRRVLEILDHAKKREGKKSVYRQLQVLLGLFKSYKPECVPEDVPAISIHTAFKKLNANLLKHFERTRERRNASQKQKQHLLWINSANSERGRNKRAEPLVPNVEFLKIGSQKYEKEPQKNILDFSDPVSVVQYSVRQGTSRPARLRALLCNATGLTLLAVSTYAEQAFLSHDLHHLLNSCFLDVSPHTYAEKQDLLHRLALLQHTLLQGVPVITRFLAQYLPLWNQKDYFYEILELAHWVSVDSPSQILSIVSSLSHAYATAQPLRQCAVLAALTQMYTNMVYSSTRTSPQHFMGADPSPAGYSLILPQVAQAIRDMCNKGLQADPDDMRVLYSSTCSVERVARCEARSSAPPGALPAPLELALPVLGPSAALLDKMAAVMLLYKKIYKTMKSKNKLQPEHNSHLATLTAYSSDLINCLYKDEAFSSRKIGFIFRNMHPQLVAKLGSLMPEIDALFSIRNHLAFAPYTFIQLAGIDHRDADNKRMFHAVIDQDFTKLSRFLKKGVQELNYQ